MTLDTVHRGFDERDTWDSYSRELEKYFKANRVRKDNERVAILLSVLSPSLYEVLSDSCEPEFPRLKTYAELSKLLKIHHSPKPSIFKQRREFYSATQAPTESVSDWLARVVKLAASCDFGDRLDLMVEDNFLSGLARHETVRRSGEGKGSVPSRNPVGVAEKYTPPCSTGTSLLDLPDEVLVQIILLLNARERLPLANSCHKFKALVFEDPNLLNHLDYSKKGGLTTMTQIRRYFANESARQHIRGINAENVACIRPGDLLNNSIGKGLNLVEVNLHGTQFIHVLYLGSFLKPLLHLEKLSIDWPTYPEDDTNLCKRILHRPFSKLTFLSVRFEVRLSRMFASSLRLCRQLKELHMKSEDRVSDSECTFWNSETLQLTELKIVRYCGRQGMWVLSELAAVLPEAKRWTNFQQCGHPNHHGFYIEKDIEVCEELLLSDRLQEFLNDAPWENFKFKWTLNSDCLLKEVLRITHRDVPEDLCCLSTLEKGGQLHLLKIEEAKRWVVALIRKKLFMMNVVELLLKDPTYQISSLYLIHNVGRNCDVHLLASAFPNLAELVLYAVSTDEEEAPRNSYFPRRLSKRCSPVPEKQDDSPNLDSSFKMLVENTPNLRHFTLGDIDGYGGREERDLDALCHISSWQNLETLHLLDVPEGDGQFLIEIGKRCKNLQKLWLEYVPSCSETVILFEMLKYCRNLRDLTIRCDRVDQSEMFAWLAKNVELERIEAVNPGVKHSVATWISCFARLVNQPGKLSTVICNTKLRSKKDLHEAVSAVKRIEGELRRPDFQIEVTCSYEPQ